MRRGEGGGPAPLTCLCVTLVAGLASGCLQCDEAFNNKFSHYRKNMDWKTWWIGDRLEAQRILTTWPRVTLKKMTLTIPPDIPKDTLQDVARKIYTKLDHIYKTFIHRPGKFSQSLRTILDLQVRLLEAAIIDGRVECEKQCGIYEYTAISCGNCSGTVIACFGYTCSSALDWEVALRSIPEYVNELARGTAQHLLLSTEIANFSGSDTGRYVFWKPDKLFLTRKMPFVSVMKPFFTRFKSKQKKYRN
ncbi:hypothetical protein FKM82_014871 [Ascaphus truei]